MGPLYFRQVDGPFALIFREDNMGRITYLFTDAQTENAFVKLDWSKLRVSTWCWPWFAS